MEMVDTDAGEGSAAISPTFSRSQGSRGLSDLQRRHDNPGNSADKSPSIKSDSAMKAGMRTTGEICC